MALSYLVSGNHTGLMTGVIKQRTGQSQPERTGTSSLVFDYALLQHSRDQSFDLRLLSVMKSAPHCGPVMRTNLRGDSCTFIRPGIGVRTERDVDIIPVEFRVVAIDGFTSSRSAIGKLAVF